MQGRPLGVHLFANMHTIISVALLVLQLLLLRVREGEFNQVCAFFLVKSLVQHLEDLLRLQKLNKQIELFAVAFTSFRCKHEPQERRHV